jgi:quinol-cytochrome oxidoreductase complex cytochrome b subunit
MKEWCLKHPIMTFFIVIAIVEMITATCLGQMPHPLINIVVGR